jgi:hypothetical protein
VNAGDELLDRISSEYELRPDEEALLEQAAATLNELEAIEATLDGAPLMVDGPRGELRPHPLLAEQRQRRALLASLLKQLGLPDVVAEGERSPLSTKRSRAAQTRWNRQRAAEARANIG